MRGFFFLASVLAIGNVDRERGADEQRHRRPGDCETQDFILGVDGYDGNECRGKEQDGDCHQHKEEELTHITSLGYS